MSGNYSGYQGYSPTGADRGSQEAAGRRTYPMVEVSFQLPQIHGNPFDYTQNDVIVTFATPAGRSVKIPAFFDGGTTWRARYTPQMPGRLEVASVTLNGMPVNPEKLEKREFQVSGTPAPGFIRIDPSDGRRFQFENGTTFFPLGNNQAWGDGKPGDIEGRLEKMGKAGENWSRIWMDAWDGKNLDWLPSGSLPVGQLSLDVARKWDAIVAAAEKNHIHFQMVLQHHGQYSTQTDSNWDQNPWNVKNGGFLSTPDEFFTNPRAIALTKAKYRYIIARWGYSPAIMAWELFNEVQYTDAVLHHHEDEVAAWHREMARFIRQQDPYKHLITSSSSMDLMKVWEEMDYLQPHAYPPAPLAAAELPTREHRRPIFFGEFGPARPQGDGTHAWYHNTIWAGIMGSPSGGAQLWDWHEVDRLDVYQDFHAAAAFLAASGLPSRRGLVAAAPEVDTPSRASLAVSPGGGWSTAKQTDFTVLPTGYVAGLAALPSYLQGTAHKQMLPLIRFHVDYPASGTFRVEIDQVSAGGGHVLVRVDGSVAGSKEIPGEGRQHGVNEFVEVRVPTGAHTVEVENEGADWVRVDRFVLNPYAPSLAVIGRSAPNFAGLWILNRNGPSPGQGRIILAGMKPGDYRLVWWDTRQGQALQQQTLHVASGHPATFVTPEVADDLAAYLEPVRAQSASRKNAVK
ncbi:MAG: DUF5060 domain-containing protein [Chthonomonadales bacterium]